MPSNHRVEPYTALAEVYQVADFAAYGKAIAPRLLDIAFELDWTGRNLLDLACGTGDVACWFAKRGLRVTGVDLSPAMLRYGARQAEADGLSAQFVVGDIRAFKPEAPFDLVTCLGSSLNYAPTLRDLERIIKTACDALETGKLFLFDLRTIQGLAIAGAGDRIVADNPESFLILSRNSFSYETMTLTTAYTIFRYDQEADAWQRAEETHMLRGYPVQAVTRLLSQYKFKVLRMLTPDFELAENQRDVEQILFVAQREA